ncbi:hypothetical protein EVAR_71580_1, partial [Eumeta japonica]
MANENDQHQNGQQNTKTNDDTENMNDDDFKINKQQPPTQISSFSFKHFLSSNSVPTAPSTTVTSLDPPANSTSTTSTSNATTSSRSLQTSTGARPKVPQSSSVSSTSISSLTVGGSSDAQAAATKMKRSPRFSSFDSQASLAEYAGSTATAELPLKKLLQDAQLIQILFVCMLMRKERDHFKSLQIPLIMIVVAHMYHVLILTMICPNLKHHLVDVFGIGASIKDTRPTRLALNSSHNPTASAKLKLDLPLTSNSIGCGVNHAVKSFAQTEKLVIALDQQIFQLLILCLVQQQSLQPYQILCKTTGWILGSYASQFSQPSFTSRKRSLPGPADGEILTWVCQNQPVRLKRDKTCCVKNAVGVVVYRAVIVRLLRLLLPITTHSTSATTAAAGTVIGGIGNSSVKSAVSDRPNSISYQRDLRRAASNAEQNLKQLLAGVENLRQMAANIEKSEQRIDYDASPDLFSDFLDECDDYDEYAGGGQRIILC